MEEKVFFEEANKHEKCDGCGDEPVVGKRWSKMSNFYWLVCKDCMKTDEWDIDYS